jgi:hypothetical protein
MSLKGVSFAVGKGSARRPIRGIRGVILELAANLPIKVQDKRGRGLSNTRVTVSNPTSGTPSVGFTDLNGNVLLDADGSNPNPVKVEKEKAFSTKDFTGGNTFTIQFEPPLP